MSCVWARLLKGKNVRNVAPYQHDKQNSPQSLRRMARAAPRHTRWSWRSRSGSSCERPWQRWQPWRGAASRSGSGAAGCSCTWAGTRSPRPVRRLSAALRQCPCPCPWVCPPWRSPPSWSRSGTWACWAPLGCSASSRGCPRLHQQDEKSQKNNYDAIKTLMLVCKLLPIFVILRLNICIVCSFLFLKNICICNELFLKY